MKNSIKAVFSFSEEHEDNFEKCENYEQAVKFFKKGNEGCYHKEFKTRAEYIAYCAGIEDSNGWLGEPSWRAQEPENDRKFIIDQLSNSMEFYNCEEAFINHIGEQTLYDGFHLSNAYTGYYELSAKARNDIHFNWGEWLDDIFSSNCYQVNYLDKDNGFQETKKLFQSYYAAKEFCFDTMDKFDPDYITTL